MNKEKNTKRIQILVSVILAILLWGYVVFTENPTITAWAHAVPVELNGLRELNAKGLTVVLADKPTVDVKLTGTRQSLYEKKDGDVTASIDFSAIDTPGTYTFSVGTEIATHGVSIATVLPEKIEITVEKQVSITKKVSVQTTGKCADGYSVSSVEAENVTVTGPESIVSGLTVVADPVSVNGAQSDVSVISKVNLANANGKTVYRVDTRLKTASTKVTCRVECEKEVPIHIETKGEPPEGYRFEIESNVSEIMIFGTASALRDIDEVSTQTLNVDGITEPKEYTVKAALPAGVRTSADTSIVVTVRPVPDHEKESNSNSPDEKQE